MNLKAINLSVLVFSVITLLALSYTLLYPTAHENWYPVRTSALANVPIDEMAKLDSKDIARIAIDVSEYNSKYINGATKRISELKISLVAAICMLLITTALVGLNVFRAKT